MIPADASGFFDGGYTADSMDEWRSTAIVILGSLMGEIEFLLQDVERRLEKEYSEARARGEQEMSTDLASRLAEAVERRKKLHTLIVELTRLARAKPKE
jgi:hypothetical protein